MRAGRPEASSWSAGFGSQHSVHSEAITCLIRALFFVSCLGLYLAGKTLQIGGQMNIP